jgi:hypothetical protein
VPYRLLDPVQALAVQHAPAPDRLVHGQALIEVGHDADLVADALFHGPCGSQILRRIVSDRITVAERNSGLAADLWVNGKELVISGAGGRVVAATLKCEKVEDVSGSPWDVGIWDLAVWGV